MQIEFKDTEDSKTLETSEQSEETPNDCDSPLKTMILQYVGTKFEPVDNNVTIEMVISTFAEEFKEFLLPICENNWLAGYEKALDDVEAVRNAGKEPEDSNVE